MYIKQFNDSVTKGRYEINSFQLHSVFPEANSFLIDYILNRSYLNAGDSRVRRDGDASTTFYDIALNAVAKIGDGDKFDLHDGEMLIKLKLHDKMAKFLNGFREILSNDCEKMKDRIAHFPSSILAKDIIYPEIPRRFDTLMDYSITDSHSYAKWMIPMEGDGGYTTIRQMCIQIADYACEALRNRKNVDYMANALIQRFMWEFSDEIEEKLTSRIKHLGGGNWNVEKSYGNVRRMVITAHTKRSPEDKHDPAKAAQELVKILNRSFCKLERIARNIAIKILNEYARVGRISKPASAVYEARKYCIERGLAKEGQYPLKQIDSLVKAKR